MITVRPSGERGRADHGWLQTRYTFSFAGYLDPAHMGFRDLRVINEDHVQPGRGFGAHSHRDMEIITWMVSGSLMHRDSVGNSSMLSTGYVQRMTAGTGVTHSEMNASDTEALHLLQIWILPERQGLPPGYQEKQFPDEARRNRLRTLVSGSEEDGALTVHQDVKLFASLLEAGREVTHTLEPDRHGWVQVIRGGLQVNGTSLEPGDGAAASGESRLALTAGTEAEFLLFDLG